MASADTIPGMASFAAGVAPRGRQALAIVALWAVFVIATGVPGFSGVVARMSTDDAMRLAEVRDLIAGQNWFDLTQYRLNPPDGTVMHWSRVIDLPIALILGALQSVFPADLALRLMLVIWPGLLLLPTLFACSSASRTLAGPTAAIVGPVMLLMSPVVTGHFAPAAIDHHGAQIALALTMLACALRLDRSIWAGAGAGLAAAVMLAIGMETLPHVAAIAALVALRWGFEGGRVAPGARIFGMSFGLSTAAVAFATLGPAAWSAPVCDALGAGHLLAALVGGLGLWTAATFARDEAFSRFAALGALAALVLLAVALVAPECLGSPYAGLPELVKQGWLADVREAQPFVSMIVTDPTSAAVVGLPLLAIAGVAIWLAMTAEDEARWPVAMAAAAFGVGCAVALWQVRGVNLAYAFGGTLLPAAAIAVWRTGEGWARLGLAVVGLAPATLAVAALGAAHAAGLSAGDKAPSADLICPVADYRALDRLEPGLILSPVDVGPFIIAHSAHSAVAAPYHRDVEGIGASLEAFGGAEETARAVAVSRRADYVVVCEPRGGARLPKGAPPDGFAAKLSSGQAPDWLRPVDLGPGARLKVWRVLAGRR